MGRGVSVELKALSSVPNCAKKMTTSAKVVCYVAEFERIMSLGFFGNTLPYETQSDESDVCMSNTTGSALCHFSPVDATSSKIHTDFTTL